MRYFAFSLILLLKQTYNKPLKHDKFSVASQLQICGLVERYLNEETLMIKHLINKFGTTIYIQIWENRIKVVDTISGVVFDEAPLVAIETTKSGQEVIIAAGNSAKSITVNSNVIVVNPFSHPRALLNDFCVAEKLIQYTFHQILGKKLLSPSPAVIIQPMDKTEGGLTMIEKKAFRELALGAGARDVVLKEGAPIIDVSNVNFKTLKELENDFGSINKKTNKSPVQWVFFVIYIGLIIMAVMSNN